MPKRRFIRAFCFYYPVAYSPTIINTVNCWSEINYDVELICDRKIFGSVIGLGRNAAISYLSQSTIEKAVHQPEKSTNNSCEARNTRRPQSRLPQSIKVLGRTVLQKANQVSRSLSRFIQSVRQSNDSFFWLFVALILSNALATRIRRQTRMTPCSFGFDDCGAVLSYCYSILSGTPFYIHSLELDNLPAFKFRLTRFAVKKLLKRAIKRAKFVVIQDEKRAAAYVDYTGAKPKEFVYFPVGHRSSPTEVPQPPIQPRNKLGAIMVGAMSPATQARELASQVTKPDWPKDWYLHFHGFCTSPELLQYFAKLANEYPSRFGFSLEHYSDSEIYSMLTHFHAGICLYGERGPNYELTIFSSGKIAQYLQCGLPVVVNDFPFTQQVVDDLQIGITIQSCDELSSGLTQLASMDGMREKSLAAFEKHYNFDRNFAKILDQFSIQPSNETTS